MKRLIANVERLTQVLNAVANGITVQDHEGKLVFVNESAARMMHCSSSEEALAKGGMAILEEFDFFDLHGRPLDPKHLPGRQALQGVPEPSVIVGYLWRGKPDSLRWTTIKALPITDEEGKVLLSVNVLEDVTEQMRVERQLKEANARVTKLLEQTLTVDDSNSNGPV
jgi:PAS domain-containing protein